MIRLNILVEGQSEERFVRDLLAPCLGEQSVFAVVRKVETSRKRRRFGGREVTKIFRGGLSHYLRAKNDLTKWMKEDQDPGVLFTTMFDLFRLPADFPGFAQAHKQANPYEKVAILEAEFAGDLDDPRFVPYIQLHEFEALILSHPARFDSFFLSHKKPIERIRALCEQFTSPEEIDDGQETAPSRRIAREIPEYLDAKPTAGPLIARNIGLPQIRAKCPHFNEWLARLENLGKRGSS